MVAGVRGGKRSVSGSGKDLLSAAVGVELEEGELKDLSNIHLGTWVGILLPARYQVPSQRNDLAMHITYQKGIKTDPR